MTYTTNKKSTAIMVAVSVIALALATTTSFNHSYTVFGASKKTGSGGTGHSNGVTTLGSISSPSSSTATDTATHSSKILTKKQISSLMSCINTANKSEGLTHKVVTSCLDIAKGKTPTPTAFATHTASISNPSLITPLAVSPKSKS
jgi:hypothetical protein